jgi:hypothetical protein
VTWQEDAACLIDDARQWDDAGTPYAHMVCRNICPVQPECLADAMKERPIGQMRAGVPFPEPRIGGQSKRPLSVRYLEHEMWHRMWLEGLSFLAISRRVGRHHTTVMNAVKRIERRLGDVA